MKLVRHLGIILLTVVFAIAQTACTDEEYHSRLRELIINNVTFGASGGSDTQTFRTEDLSNYVAKADQEWCQAAFSERGLTVSVPENTTYEERIAKVTLSDKQDASVTRTLQVTQSQNDAVLIAENTYEVAADGGKVTINVQHNVDYNVEISDSAWIKEAPEMGTRALKTTAIVLTVAKNNSGGERMGVVTISNSTTGERIDVAIKQLFTPTFSVSGESLTIDEQGGILRLLVTTNSEVTTIFGDDWVQDGGKEQAEELIYWQDIKVAPFTEKTSSRTSTVTFANIGYGIYKDVKIQQTRPLYIQAVTVPLKVDDTYNLPLCNDKKAAVIWQSGNEKVATVDTEGKVKAIGVGTSTIKVASSDGLHADSVTVTVGEKEVKPDEPVFEIMTNGATIDERGGEVKILVKANFDTDLSFGDTWLTAGGKEKADDLYYWQKVKVEPYTGKTASRTSTAIFSHFANGIYKEVKITQTRNLFIQAQTIQLTVGDELLIPLYNAEQMAVTWTSSNGKVATVGADGKATAKAAGSTVITVTSVDGLHKDEVSVTVVAKNPDDEEPEFSLMTAESLTIDEQGGELQLLFKTNKPVSVGFSDTWLSDGGQTKVGDLTYKHIVKVQPLADGMKERSATITISNLEKGIYKEVKVTQVRSQQEEPDDDKNRRRGCRRR